MHHRQYNDLIGVYPVEKREGETTNKTPPDVATDYGQALSCSENLHLIRGPEFHSNRQRQTVPVQQARGAAGYSLQPATHISECLKCISGG